VRILKNIFSKKDHLKVSLDITAVDGICIARKNDTIDEPFLIHLEERNSGKEKNALQISEIDMYHHFKILLDSDKYHFITNSKRTKNHMLKMLATIQLSDFIIKELRWMSRYPYHYHHTLAIVLMVIRILFDLYKDETEIKEVAADALSHDIGITRVPKDVLTKVSSLNDNEKNIISEHPVYSYLLLTYYWGDRENPNALLGYNHHENELGTGYPRGIIQNDSFAQYVQLCDIYDALRSDRPFRPALTMEQAQEEIKRLVDDHLINPDAYSIFMKCFGK